MCEQCTREWDFSPDIAASTQACRKAWLLFFGKHPPFSNPSIHPFLQQKHPVCLWVNACVFMIVVLGPIRWQLWGFWRVKRRRGCLQQENKAAGKRRRRRLSVQEQEISPSSPCLCCPQRSGEKWDERSCDGAATSFGCPDEMWEWLWAVGLCAWPSALPQWQGWLQRSERGNGQWFDNAHPNHGYRTTLPVWWLRLARYEILNASNTWTCNPSGREFVPDAG